MAKYIIGLGIASIVLVFLFGFSGKSNQITVQNSPTTPPKGALQKQLDDVNKKKSQLPELEEDIFGKCLSEKGGKTANNIKTCQDLTQKQIFTLSQDLNNIKNNLEGQLK